MPSEQTQAPDTPVQIGERVRIVSVPEGDDWLVSSGQVKIGDVGTVTDIDTEVPPILVRVDGHGPDETWWFNAENLERAGLTGGDRDG